MSCSNRTVVRPRTKRHRELIESMKENCISFQLSTDYGKREVIATLDPSVLPDSTSDQYKNSGIDFTSQHVNEFIECWSFNKNYNKRVASTAGWCKIPLSSILDYNVIDQGTQDAV